MTKLKLGRIRDDKPVKLTVDLPAELHRDLIVYGEILGVSFLAPCVMRLRHKEGGGWRRAGAPLEPGSAYRLSGAARRDWEHSIPPMAALRYSITFRTLA